MVTAQLLPNVVRAQQIFSLLFPLIRMLLCCKLLSQKKKKIVTGKMYKCKILHTLQQQYQKNVKTVIKDILLLHNYAPAHKLNVVTDFQIKEEVIEIPHSAFSPNLPLVTFISSQSLWKKNPITCSWMMLNLKIITWVLDLSVCEGSA